MKAQQQKILLSQPVQYFRAAGDKLVRVGWIDEGSFFNIGDVVSKTWDHHDQPAVPFTKQGEEYFLLVKELSQEQQRFIIPVSVH